MKNMKKILALGLAMTMLMTSASCGGKEPEGNKGQNGTDKTEEGDFPKVDPYTKGEVQDMDGYEFTIAATFQYYDDPTGRDLIVSEQAWQSRREEVEQLYNCKIKVIP